MPSFLYTSNSYRDESQYDTSIAKRQVISSHHWQCHISFVNRIKIQKFKRFQSKFSALILESEYKMKAAFFWTPWVAAKDLRRRLMYFVQVAFPWHFPEPIVSLLQISMFFNFAICRFFKKSTMPRRRRIWDCIIIIIICSVGGILLKKEHRNKKRKLLIWLKNCRNIRRPGRVQKHFKKTKNRKIE